MSSESHSSSSSPVDVVVRSWNDYPIIEKTLQGLSEQDCEIRLTSFDNDSTDGTTECMERAGAKMNNVPAGTYVPGKVINDAMAATESDIVVFINSDCIPQSKSAISEILKTFDGKPNVAGAFGKQVPHADCWTIYYKDTNDTYGDGSRHKYWKNCFSMAFSAISRAHWEKLPFRTEVQYSEDIDWSWRARQAGYDIAYAKDAPVMHSHNYTWKQFYKRQFGEGKADAQIFEWTSWERTWLRYALLPFGRQSLSDLKYMLKRGKIHALPSSPYFRSAQMLGRWKGFREGLALGKDA